jgi:hypothetical protein
MMVWFFAEKQSSNFIVFFNSICPEQSFIFLPVIFDTRDHLDSTTASFADRNTYMEYPFLGLCSCHGRPAFDQVFYCLSYVAPGVLHLPRITGVIKARCLLFGANTPWDRVRLTLGLGTMAASRAMKSSGSKMTWVVPSLYVSSAGSGCRRLTLTKAASPRSLVD